MNPKAAEAWNFALAKMASAQEYMEQDQDEIAKTEIAKAVYVGAGALYYLLGQGQAEQAAYDAAQRLIADLTESDCSGSDAHAAACDVLNGIAELSPDEDKLPTV